MISLMYRQPGEGWAKDTRGFGYSPPVILQVSKMVHKSVARIFTFLILVAACSDNRGTTRTYEVHFDHWTRESNLFTFYFAADSALFGSREPLRVEPPYHADTNFYGILLWNERGDSLADSQVDLVRDVRPDGTEIFYFDRNNNEDLTDDGPPLQWQVDTTREDVAFLSLNSSWPEHYPIHARILHRDVPLDKMLSRQAGRPVLVYSLVTFGARRGVWHMDSTSYDIELFSMLNSGRISGMPGEWFVIDVNQDGSFEFLLPDIRVLLTEPEFELAGTRWRAEVDSLGDVLTLTQIVEPGTKPDTSASKTYPAADTGKFAGTYVEIPAKPFAEETLAGEPVSRESLLSRVLRW